MQRIEERLRRLEQNQPSLVTVVFSNGNQRAVNALAAFKIAAEDAGAVFYVPGNEAMKNLLNAVQESMRCNDEP